MWKIDYSNYMEVKNKVGKNKMYYYILGAPIAGKFKTFMKAFKYQQKYHEEKKIIFKDNIILEVVWNPEWSKINCNNL